MTTLAVYSSKGGVGKTSLAVNLAWASATLSSRRTLLWDLDAQASASFILAPNARRRVEAREVIARNVAPDRLIVGTAFRGLDLLPADPSLRALDLLFADIGANKRLLRIGESLAKDYDRVVIDCPPGLGLTAGQVIRGASLILLPIIPSALAVRATDDFLAYLQARKKAPPIMPVFNLADRRRSSHREALAQFPERPVIPMASAVEQMADRHKPLGAYAPRSAAAIAVADLWRDIEQRIVQTD